MRKGGGSNKGSEFEREICKKLSKWVSDGERDDIYWRTAGSGARATCRARKGKATANSDGDVGCLDNRYGWFTDRVLIELKRGYNHWRISDFLLPGRQPKDSAWAVWVSLEKEAHRLRKVPLLVLKQDRRPVLFFFPFQHSGVADFTGVCIQHPALMWPKIWVAGRFFDTPVMEIRGCLP